MSSKWGIGIVGCGTVSDVHARAIAGVSDAELVSVYSRNIDNAARVAQEHGVPANDNWQKFIRDSRLDLVSICTPSGTHLDYGRRAAEAGKHVVVEKPIEVTLDRGRELMDVCRLNDVRLAVIYQNRFLPDVIELKEKIESDQLGPLFLADAYIKWFRKQAYYDSAAWRGTLALDGGGVLINQAIHTIDLLQYLVGEVESVYGQTGAFTHERIEGEDTAVACLRFRNGALGVIEASTSVQPGQPRRLEVHGGKGTAMLDGDSLALIGSERRDQGNRKASGGAAPLQDFSVEPHRRQFQAIVGALSRDEQPPVSGDESLASLAIVLAIYESARRNTPVKLSEFIGA